MPIGVKGWTGKASRCDIIKMKNELIVRNLSKTFPSPSGYKRISVLENINITIQSGEFVSVLGPSGCGKSTLLSILMDFVKPDNGAITGLPIKGSQRKNAHHVGLEGFGKHYPHQLSGDIEEALYLSDRIYILSSRPGTVIREINVPFARPRDIDSIEEHEFLHLKRQLRKDMQVHSACSI